MGCVFSVDREAAMDPTMERLDTYLEEQDPDGDDYRQGVVAQQLNERIQLAIEAGRITGPESLQHLVLQMAGELLGAQITVNQSRKGLIL